MTTFFLIPFLVGLGLSVITFGTGALHGHHFHMPKIFRASRRTARGAWLNAAAITAFLVWFGGGGLLIERLTPWSLPLMLSGASVIGVTGASIINRLIGALARQEATAERLTMLGTIGRVVLNIRAGGTGEIVFTHQGTRRVAGARSDTGRAIEKGTEVVVVRYEKGIAYVTTWDELPALTPEA